MTDNRKSPQESTERCVVCQEPIGAGEGRYRTRRGPVHMQCRGKMPEDER